MCSQTNRNTMGRMKFAAAIKMPEFANDLSPTKNLRMQLMAFSSIIRTQTIFKFRKEAAEK